MTVADAAELHGPVRRPRNLAHDVAGSIHDDATAGRLGFRGGTVAGNIHMDQFVPLLLEVFGERWFETGSLSLGFVNATTDAEPVQAIVARPPDGDDVQVAVRMIAADGAALAGAVVAEGTASLGSPAEPSALHGRDLRPGDPGSLRILQGIGPGTALDGGRVRVGRERQAARIAGGGCTEPLPWYTAPSPWGGPIASPMTMVELLYRTPTMSLAGRIGDAVGLFGAIEIRHLAGPVLLDEDYDVTGTVVAVGESPKTEYLWFDSVALDSNGRAVASMRMQTRMMKASSPLYAGE